MKRSLGSLIALTLGCTVAATIFGFGSEVFSLRSVYKGLGREELIQATRLFVYVALGVLLGEGGPFGIPFEDAQLAHALGLRLADLLATHPVALLVRND